MTIFLIFAAAKLTYAASWYDPAWQYRKAITIDYTKVSGTQANFPLLIQRSNADWKDTTNGGKVAQSDGGDIVFTSTDGTTKLDHEIERYTPSTGEVVAWVRIPTLSASTDTVIYIYYGNAACADQWNVNAVWDSNYVGVWHKKDATTTTIADSTSNTNPGTKLAVGEPVEATGKIGKAQSYDGVNDKVSITNAPIFTPSDNYSVSFWAKIDPTQTYWQGVINFKTGSSWGIYASHASQAFLYTGPGGTGATNQYFSSNTIPNLGEWVYYTLTKQGTVYTWYIDGKLSTQQNKGAGDVTMNTASTWTIGFDYSLKYKGLIDEVRVSNVVRTAGWITTEYNNQVSPNTFYSVERETTIRNATVRNATVR